LLALYSLAGIAGLYSSIELYPGIGFEMRDLLFVLVVAVPMISLLGLIGANRDQDAIKGICSDWEKISK
jgi:hypothetical protein